MANITFKENPVTLQGQQKQEGDQAPDFTVLDRQLQEVSFSEAKGKKVLISAVPSVDTSTCDQQTRRFNEEVEQVAGAEIWTISLDLPFAQRRWCADSGLEQAKLYSDHRSLDFAMNYGVLMEELRLLARAVFVVDSKGTITYTEYVPEVSGHPDYDAALEALKKAE
ncbi:thiol peroxidase [Alkalicoccus chagannorensis]|uniref:thiol peroxidase n=1 Tax=Alkalicoccus chagannorensis TaxID=427072 RepID=UPI00042807A3|nr:thiol peroxidase [Alkalicoccus chagannorensis]